MTISTADKNGNLNNLIGQFVHAETDVLFFYAEGGCPWMEDYFIEATGITHTIECRRNEFRGARILKTVAYVLIDEDENGEPVWEKWPLKRHYVYEA